VKAIHKHVEMDIMDEVLYLYIEYKIGEDIGESMFNLWNIVEQKVSYRYFMPNYSCTP
jgi:hypothetical protein